MSSLLSKAIAARLRENHEEADRLFHEFVLSRAKTVNEALVSGEEVDVDAIVEGKTYKRGKDEDEDVSGKKQKDQERKSGSKQKRQTDESLAEAANDHTIEAYGVKGAQSTKWRKTFKDADALASWIDANDAEVEGQKDLKVEEGQLTATQGDDGTLVIVHDPAGSDAMAPTPAMPVGDDLADVGADPMLGVDDDMDFEDDIMSPDLEVSDDPLPGVDDLNDEAFESLKESLAEDLKTILIDNNDGEYADGSKASQETHSPIPNVDAEDRMDGAEPVKIKGANHNGFDKEPAPKVEKGMKAENTKERSTEGQTINESEEALITVRGEFEASDVKTGELKTIHTGAQIDFLGQSESGRFKFFSYDGRKYAVEDYIWETEV